MLAYLLNKLPVSYDVHRFIAILGRAHQRTNPEMVCNINISMKRSHLCEACSPSVHQASPWILWYSNIHHSAHKRPKRNHILRALDEFYFLVHCMFKNYLNDVLVYHQVSQVGPSPRGLSKPTGHLLISSTLLWPPSRGSLMAAVCVRTEVFRTSFHVHNFFFRSGPKRLGYPIDITKQKITETNLIRYTRQKNLL